MNVVEIEKELEKMSEAERTELLNMEFPAELVKQAEAELASNELAANLYALGAMYADKAIASADGIDKVAAEQVAEFDAAEAELGAAIEAGLQATGINEIADEGQMHKEASAAAGLILAGYSDYLLKEAGPKLDKVKGAMKKGYDAVKGAAGKAYEHVKKHRGAYGAAAGGAAAGAGAEHLRHRMKKKASECTVEEIQGTIMEDLALDATIDECFNTIAEAGIVKAAGFKETMSGAAGKAKAGAKAVGAHLSKYRKEYGAGAAGAAVGAGAAHMAQKKK